MKRIPDAGTIQRKAFDYFKTEHELTQAKATQLLGHFSLPVAVHALRKKGWPILSKEVKGPTGAVMTFYRMPKHAVMKTASGLTAKVEVLEFKNAGRQSMHRVAVRFKSGAIAFAHPSELEAL